MLRYQMMSLFLTHMDIGDHMAMAIFYFVSFLIALGAIFYAPYGGYFASPVAIIATFALSGLCKELLKIMEKYEGKDRDDKERS